MTYLVDEQTGCHVWRGTLSERGYAKISIGPMKVRLARLLWKIFKGPIPPFMLVLHTCDNRACIKLEHLYLGDHARNMLDRAERGRTPKGGSNGQAILTEVEVYEIRASLEPGLKLAAKYGVSPPTISRIRHRHIWKHLPEREIQG